MSEREWARAAERNANRVIRVELNLRTALLALSVMAGVWLFTRLWPVLLVIVVALMIVGALNPVIEWLQKHRFRRPYAIALVFGTLLLALIGVMAVTVPRLITQVTELMQQVPDLQRRAADSLAQSRFGAQFAHSVGEAKWPELLLNLARAGVAYSPDVIEGAGYCLITLFLSLYLLIDRDRLRGALFSLLPRTHHVRLSRVLINLEVIVGGYLRGQVITSLIATGVTFVVLSVARVPGAIALAVFAGLTDILPYVGSLLACGPAAMAALSVSVPTAVVVLIALVLYQELESRIIVPQLYGMVLRLPSAVIVVALLVGGKLLGIVGALLALPIAAGLRMMVTTLRVELPGDGPVNEKERADDAEAELEFQRRAAGVRADRAAAIAMDIAETERLLHVEPPPSTRSP